MSVAARGIAQLKGHAVPYGIRNIHGRCTRQQLAPLSDSSGNTSRSLPVCNGIMSDRASSNPALRFGQFNTMRRNRNDSWGDDYRGRSDIMTMQGTVGKTAVLLLITLCGAAYVWQQFALQLAGAASMSAVVAVKGGISQVTTVSGIGGMIVAFATLMKPNWAPWSAPLYAAMKGAVLGALSFQFEAMFPGIVQSAVLITMGTAGGMLAAYQSGLIAVTDKLRSIITTATIGVMLAYLSTMILRLVGVNMAFLSSGPTGLLFGGFTALVAASCLLLDFDSIQTMQYSGMPRWMEWYGGFTILVTLVWLYSEILRFLAMLANNRE